MRGRRYTAATLWFQNCGSRLLDLQQYRKWADALKAQTATGTRNVTDHVPFKYIASGGMQFISRPGSSVLAGFTSNTSHGFQEIAYHCSEYIRVTSYAAIQLCRPSGGIHRPRKSQIWLHLLKCWQSKLSPLFF